MQSITPEAPSRSDVEFAADRLDFLRGASLACRFFGLFFGSEPTEELLRLLKEQRLLDVWPLEGSAPHSRDGADLIRTFIDQPGPFPFELAFRDYTDLFIGPEHPLKQWESVWTTRDRLLYGEPSVAVSEIYSRYGFLPVGPEPGDHIALEFIFLAELFKIIVLSAEKGDGAGVARLLNETREFHDRHLGRWAECFLEELEQRAATDFYRGAALLCRATLDSIRNVLGAMQ